MATVNIALPDTMKDFVKSKIQQGGYNNISEYFRDLVRQDQSREADKRLEALILEGLNSGAPVKRTDELAQARREELAAKYGKNQ